MNKSNINIWNFIKEPASKEEFQTDSIRYKIHQNRLEKLITSSLKSELSCTYFADYKQSLQNKSKWNWVSPVYCKKSITNIFTKIFIFLFQIRLEGQNSSFSDFIFRDLNKKVIIRFEKSDKFNLTFKEFDYINKLIISLPVKNFINATIDKNKKIKWYPYINDWEVINLDLLKDVKAKIDDTLAKNEFENFLTTDVLLQCQNFFLEHTNSDKITEQDLKNVMWVMYSSLAFEKIHAYTYIPSIPIKSDDKEESSGGLIIPEFEDKKKLSDENQEILFLIVQKWFSENAIADFSEAAKKEVEASARKAAFAEVNARTTSHNTGSHIMTNDLSGESKEALTKFHNYLRQRMLYNSDITSSVSSFESEYSLKDIFSIAKSEFCKLEIVTKYVSGYKNKKFKEFNVNDLCLNKKISLPNGVLGLQALYVIFENMIRNYFKHIGISDELSINVTIKENTDNHLCIMLSDESEPSNEKFENLVTLIDLPILNSENKLRSMGLGLLEMKGAACYLNKIPIVKIDKSTINITTTKNKKIEYRNDVSVFGVEMINKKLCFSFWLRKPKTLLVFTKNEPENKSELLDKGIELQKKQDDKNSPHQWVVVENESNIYINNSLSPRFLKRNAITDLFIKDTNVNQTLYREWIIKLCESKEIAGRLIIFIGDEDKYCFEIDKSKNQFKIAFDNHGARRTTMSNANYYEPYRSQPNPAGNILNNITQHPNIEYELFETALSEVGIIDERIQRISFEDECNDFIPNNSANPTKIKKREVLEKMRIYIPSENDEDLNKNPKISKIQVWIKKTPMDFLIIHLTLIEKLMEAEGKIEKKKEQINKWLNKKIFICLKDKSIKPHIIITTERGTPDKIPDNCRFLHYSNIVKYLFEDRSKFHLVKTLFNARKTELLKQN